MVAKETGALVRYPLLLLSAMLIMMLIVMMMMMMIIQMMMMLIVMINVGFGLLTVYLDDMYSAIITTPINLAATLQLDDGRSYVGVTAATGDEYWQAHDILRYGTMLLVMVMMGMMMMMVMIIR
jgi:hypothetical protein